MTLSSGGFRKALRAPHRSGGCVNVAADAVASVRDEADRL